MTPLVSSRQVVVDNVNISESPLDFNDMLKQAHHPEAGAVVLFSGEVRISNACKTVDYLWYEAHQSLATKCINMIIEEAKTKWNLHFALAKHRVGKLLVGESAVVVITSSKHRTEAYQANRFIIDKIKHEAPIWKCEYFTDGTKEWGGNCNCYAQTGDKKKHIYEFDSLKTE